MSKIDRRPLPPPPPPAPVAQPTPERVEVTPAVAGDRLVVSRGASKTEEMRDLTAAMEALLTFTPTTTAKAREWMARGEALYEDAAPRLLNGDMKALPLKERQTFSVALHRLEKFLERAPRIIDFLAGK